VAEISAATVKALRERTGVGMMECKRALADAGGDVERAVTLLRERGLARAVKREGRATSEGAISMALAGSVGALVELGCETDFVAKTPDFQALAGTLAKLVASDPELDSPDALLEASHDGETVRERIQGAIGRIGENIVVKRVARLDAGRPGRVGGYVHAGGRLGVIVALRTEAVGEAVDVLAKDVAMHVAAADPPPVAVERSGVPEDLVAREREVFRKQAAQSGKPPQVLDRIVEGKLNKFYSEVCLLEQPFVKDPDRKVDEMLRAAARSLGAEVTVTGYVRFALGEARGS
jgi:elongation factor Ts